MLRLPSTVKGDRGRVSTVPLVMPVSEPVGELDIAIAILDTHDGD